MLDTELYRHLLGLLEPWSVERVELNVAEQRVDVWAAHPTGQRWPCPECGTELGRYDHAEERVWRHLDSCQFLTWGLNSKIQTIKKRAYGFRNKDHFNTAIYHCRLLENTL